MLSMIDLIACPVAAAESLALLSVLSLLCDSLLDTLKASKRTV